MAFSGRIVAALALAASVLLLAGCAPTASEQPVSAGERAHIRAEILDERWGPIAETYPEALRPAIAVSHTVADADWAGAVARCLRQKGYRASAHDGTYQYGTTTGQTPLDFAIAGFVCSSTWVRQSEVELRLSGGQQRAFQSFELHQVQPCLRLAGARSAPPPTDLQLDGLTALAGWSPYDLLRKTGASKRAIGYLERRCPPIPSWMDLAD